MICKKCNKDKGDEFYSGDSSCKDCRKERVRQNRAEKAEYYREYDRERFKNDPRVRDRHARYAKSEKGIAAANKAKKKWDSKNPIKKAASTMVANAVRDKRIIKPSRCSECGKTGRLNGHHDDYAYPLVVRWLCCKCHREWHSINGNALNGGD